MKAPCKKTCGMNHICRKAEECKLWKEYVLKSRAEREKNQ